MHKERSVRFDTKSRPDRPKPATLKTRQTNLDQIPPQPFSEMKIGKFVFLTTCPQWSLAYYPPSHIKRTLFIASILEHILLLQPQPTGLEVHLRPSTPTSSSSSFYLRPSSQCNWTCFITITLDLRT